MSLTPILTFSLSLEVNEYVKIRTVAESTYVLLKLLKKHKIGKSTQALYRNAVKAGGEEGLPSKEAGQEGRKLPLPRVWLLGGECWCLQGRKLRVSLSL